VKVALFGLSGMPLRIPPELSVAQVGSVPLARA
jgi:hypothetical protein